MCPRAGLCVRNSSLSHPPRDDDDYTPPRPCSSGDAEDQMGIVKYTRKQPTVFFPSSYSVYLLRLRCIRFSPFPLMINFRLIRSGWGEREEKRCLMDYSMS